MDKVMQAAIATLQAQNDAIAKTLSELLADGKPVTDKPATETKQARQYTISEWHKGKDGFVMTLSDFPSKMVRWAMAGHGILWNGVRGSFTYNVPATLTRSDVEKVISDASIAAYNISKTLPPRKRR